MDDEERMKRLDREYDDWQANVLEPVLTRTPERKTEFRTSSSIEVKRLYTPMDLADHDYLERLGFPGNWPYTRGVRPTMYRSRLWTMRQYAGYGVAEETNRRFHFLLEQGQTGLSVAFDLPTQLGYDADDPMAVGEVGKVGVAIDSLADMEALLRDIPLDRVSVSMTINATAAILLAMYVVVAKRAGVAPEQLTGTIQNDILKEYIARGTYIFPPGPSMRLVTDTVAYCANHLPRWNAISVSGYHIREAGSTAVQEVAFTLADGIAYVEAAKAAGLDVDRIGSQLSFFFNAHNDLLEEVAKFRAARRLWATIMRRRFHARDPKSWMLRFHAQTSGVSLTAQQAENNLVRVALQALAAVLGGVQSLHTNSRDEALGLPTEDAVRLALRTQQIIAYESGAANTIDPLGGSYYLEALTDRIEREAAAYVEKIDAMGGMLRAIEVGFVQREIQEAAYREQRATEERQRIVVGVNECTTAEPVHIAVFTVDPRLEIEQRAKVVRLRRNRDNGKVERILHVLGEVAKENENLLPPLIEAVETYATIGEICAVLRRVFGEYRESVAI
ncbi:MAG: methylmalonyl-CoA mutase family protein [candidate division NC10 bacterium]|nr:methylmalonyl-CoA mutase family protein [candidate division NC10 bacterium]MDE2320326.1 methylmalonyl-CoA mutase family protein [candidate division NC10 bacterium]